MTGRGRGARDAVRFKVNPRINAQVARSPRLRAAVLFVGLRVEREAKRRAPVDTGRLRASITTRVVPGARGPVAEIGTNVNYAAAQEFPRKDGGGGKRYLGGALIAVGAQLRRKAGR